MDTAEAAAGPAAGPVGLSAEKLQHFAEHGWVLQENAFAPKECADFRSALDRLGAANFCPGPHRDVDDPSSPSAGIHNVDNMINSDEQIFRDWIVHPHILPVIKQLTGVPPTFECCHAMIKQPHPDRHDPARRAELLNPENFGWHRGIRPKYGIVDANGSDGGPTGLINTTFLNNISYFTDVDDELDGGTAILDGSHRIDIGEGKDGWQPLLSRATRLCKIKAGSVVHFTEALIHSGVPVLSERTRYTMFYGFTPPWMRCWPGSEPSAAVVEAAEGELRTILEPVG
eukprot:SAG22_NODE_233_length_14378_cov_86.382100_3_plen_286_part_00